MAVHGESLKRFLLFYKSSSLAASSSPYNWLYTEKFLPIIINHKPRARITNTFSSSTGCIPASQGGAIMKHNFGKNSF
jgi:hypothetical protein